MMKIDQNLAVTLGVVVPLVVLCLAVSVCCILRRCRNNSENTYRQVNHGLDDEEMEFKRILEKRKTNDTEMSSQFNSARGNNNNLMYDDLNDDDVTFDASELDKLNQLESYRNNLLSAGQTNSSSNQHSNMNENVNNTSKGGNGSINSPQSVTDGSVPYNSNVDDEIRL